MTGPEHYVAAEELLRHAAIHVSDALPDRFAEGTGADSNLAAAQVHATLALAAATALPAVGAWLGDETAGRSVLREWTGVSA